MCTEAGMLALRAQRKVVCMADFEKVRLRPLQSPPSSDSAPLQAMKTVLLKDVNNIGAAFYA